MDSSFLVLLAVIVSTIWVVGYFLVFKKKAPNSTDSKLIGKKDIEKPKHITLTLAIEDDMEIDYAQIVEMTFSWKEILEKAEMLPVIHHEENAKTKPVGQAEKIEKVKESVVSPKIEKKEFVPPTNYVKLEYLSQNLL